MTCRPSAAGKNMASGVLRPDQWGEKPRDRINFQFLERMFDLPHNCSFSFLRIISCQRVGFMRSCWSVVQREATLSQKKHSCAQVFAAFNNIFERAREQNTVSHYQWQYFARSHCSTGLTYFGASMKFIYARQWLNFSSSSTCLKVGNPLPFQIMEAGKYSTFERKNIRQERRLSGFLLC